MSFRSPETPVYQQSIPELREQSGFKEFYPPQTDIPLWFDREITDEDIKQAFPDNWKDHITPTAYQLSDGQQADVFDSKGNIYDSGFVLVPTLFDASGTLHDDYSSLYVFGQGDKDNQVVKVDKNGFSSTYYFEEYLLGNIRSYGRIEIPVEGLDYDEDAAPVINFDDIFPDGLYENGLRNVQRIVAIRNNLLEGKFPGADLRLEEEIKSFEKYFLRAYEEGTREEDLLERVYPEYEAGNVERYRSKRAEFGPGGFLLLEDIANRDPDDEERIVLKRPIVVVGEHGFTHIDTRGNAEHLGISVDSHTLVDILEVSHFSWDPGKWSDFTQDDGDSIVNFDGSPFPGVPGEYVEEIVVADDHTQVDVENEYGENYHTLREQALQNRE